MIIVYNGSVICDSRKLFWAVWCVFEGWRSETEGLGYGYRYCDYCHCARGCRWIRSAAETDSIKKRLWRFMDQHHDAWAAFLE